MIKIFVTKLALFIILNHTISIFVIHFLTMLSLLLTILFSTLIIITFRVLGMLKISEIQSIAFNYFFAVILGIFIWKEPFQLKSYTVASWFELSIITGVLFVLTFYLLSRSSRSVGIAITAVASRMSVMIPVLAGFLIFGDNLSITKIGGLLLAVFSFYLIFKPKGELVIDWKNILFPVLLFLGIGANDTMMKYVQYHFLSDDLTLFLTMVFFIAFIASLLLMVFRIFAKKESISLKSVAAGFVLGLLNFGSTYYFINSMAYFESSIFFPVVNVGIVLLTSLAGIVFFKERLSKINWFGIVIAVVAIMIITIA